MRVLLQRVSKASVTVENQTIASIDQGLLLFVGIEATDDHEDISWLTRKVINMRIFSDKEGKMNLSILDISGELLVISQFTLHASTKKGNRPSFIKAARPKEAEELYEKFCNELTDQSSLPLRKGSFGAHMHIDLTNDGPVTIMIDSKNRE